MPQGYGKKALSPVVMLIVLLNSALLTTTINIRWQSPILLFSSANCSTTRPTRCTNTRYGRIQSFARPLLGNAWEDYHAKISPRVAQAYLDKGDTIKALDRLSMSLLLIVAVAEKLKPLLLLRYDQKEINRELRRCMYHPKKMHDKNGHFYYYLFGHYIMYSYGGHQKEYRDYLRRNKSILFLQAFSVP